MKSGLEIGLEKSPRTGSLAVDNVLGEWGRRKRGRERPFRAQERG
jgi:hypothetical protein